MSVITKIVRYVANCRFIQHKYRKHHEALHTRTNCLSTDVWQVESAALQSYFIKRKKQFPSADKIVRKISFIKPEVKERVIQLYMARQNFMHTVRFLRWLLVNREDNFYPE